MRISDWSSDVCSSDLASPKIGARRAAAAHRFPAPAIVSVRRLVIARAMDRIETQASGGCQCGAVRYRVTAVLDTSHICHCRMCQKAAGNFFIALIGVPRDAVDWTRGAPTWFKSSDKDRKSTRL